jgi:hypothetical protein
MPARRRGAPVDVGEPAADEIFLSRSPQSPAFGTVVRSALDSISGVLGNDAKDSLCLCYIAALRGQSRITAVRARKRIVEFLHDDLRKSMEFPFSQWVLQVTCQAPPAYVML